MTEQRWQGWRRPRGTAKMWEKVPQTEGKTKGEAYQLLMTECELKNSGVTDWEYNVMLVGQVPPSTPSYPNRALRGWA